MVSVTLFWSSNYPPPKQNGNLNVAARSLITGSRSIGVRQHFCPLSPTSNHTFTHWPRPTEHFPQQAAHMRLKGQLSLRACCQVDILPTTERDIGIGQTLLVTAASAPTSMWGVPPLLAISPISSSTAQALPRQEQEQLSSGLCKLQRSPT